MDNRQPPDEIDAQLDELLKDFGLTTKVVAMADESRGPWFYINQMRQRVYTLYELDKALNRKINGVRNGAQINDSGIYLAYNRKLDKLSAKRRRTLGQWMGILAAAAGVAGPFLAGCVWIFKMVVKGVQAH